MNSKKNKEKEDAAFFEAHKDDDALWGEPVVPPESAQRRALGATITVRFPEDEADAIRRLAAELHITYSDLIRKAVKAFTQPHFTYEGGYTFRPFLLQGDVRAAAEQVIEFAQAQEAATITRSGNQPIPVPK